MLIGDTVNVAARVEQLTKTTGDAILLTQSCVDALARRPPGPIDRGNQHDVGVVATEIAAWSAWRPRAVKHVYIGGGIGRDAGKCAASEYQ
jgi:class 3 adenylate cyclase